MPARPARSPALLAAGYWWDFLVGDDWRIAPGIAVALTPTALLAHHGVTAWWLIPLAAALWAGMGVSSPPRTR
jgi:hypothetical protein